MPRSLGLTSIRILAAIHNGSRYGFDIVASTRMPSGTVYPTLARLRKRGLLTPSWEDPELAEAEGRPRRRYYVLSDTGIGVLEAEGWRLEEAGLAPRAVTG